MAKKEGESTKKAKNSPLETPRTLGDYKVGNKKPPIERQFGQVNGNPRGHGFFKIDETPRFKLEKMMKMTDDQLREIVQDKKASRFEQVLATAVHKGDIKVAFEMIDQVYGKPLQRFEGEVEMPAPLVDLTKRRRKKK